jgi:hypothetical protein
MAHSVTITTPILTWDELVQQYGLSKADQKFVIRLVDEKVARRPAGATRKATRSPRPRSMKPSR